MGSFKSYSARTETDTAVLTEGLAEGESITYWKTLPHSVSRAISSAGLRAGLDQRGRPTGTFDPGAATLERLKLGIHTWSIKDENGDWVPWDPNRASELLDGLPTAVTQALLERIGAGDPEPDLDEEADDDPTAGPPGETVGEDFAGNSEPSSEDTPRPLHGSPISSSLDDSE